MLPPDPNASNPAGPHNNPVTADLDFDLVWPDSEDLFETLMSSESANQWQLPLGAFPLSTGASSTSFGPTSSSFDKGPSIGAIPSGESHQAVHNVSEMVTALVSPSKFKLPTADKNHSLRMSQLLLKRLQLHRSF